MNQELRQQILQMRDHELECSCQQLKEILHQYGWPGYELVGEEASEAFWNLVQCQEADIPFQKECLERLEEAVKKNDASPFQFAYLTDRIRKKEGLPQLYGTQWSENGGKIMLYPVEDPESLDIRRKALHLPSWQSEKSMMRESVQLPEDAFE